MEKKKKKPKSPSNAEIIQKSIKDYVRLGDDWVALVFIDNSVIIQHASQVILANTGEIVNTLNENTRSALQHNAINPRALVTRTFALQQDGSVLCDNHGISSGGIPSKRAYKIMDSTIESVRRCGENYLPNLLSKIRNREE